jgi:hypothetical protein
MMRKTGLAKFLAKRLPVGISLAPFEFAFMAAYGIATGKYLADKLFYAVDPDVSSLALLPIKGATLWFWVAALFIGCLMACAGLLVNGYRPLLGFRMERAGCRCYDRFLLRGALGARRFLLRDRVHHDTA